ncbi:MAG TPA: PVC-type heme-binding CxxCH protein [Tepidisphaeraceae bacterium]|nr:PVC-type heme-binding CxxCH protein [Tepidisphaeraceae bacterium]
MRRSLPILFVLLACLATAGHVTPAANQSDGPAPQAAPDRRVKVLFLGDDGHHRPLDRCRQVFSEMGRRGIDFTYTDQLSDLNPDTLSRYDCVLLYANIEKIGPEQDKALLDYVASGRGFVPVHCGSYCFLNSKDITALTGARFKSHGTGVFRETHVKPDHPLLKGLRPIESWDETYVHEMHNEKDRTVLSNRVEEKHTEPYTWVRTHGKGRVFYTAWGHDQRTWGNRDFQDLIERGVRWASGDWALTPRSNDKPFQYAEAEAPIPNYPAGERWGTTAEGYRQMQLPLTPEASMRRMVLPPGFGVRLYAAEPEIKKPITMAWDERGRLWIAETVDYPNDMQPEGKGRDRITICDDTDGDGKADKFTVFAEKLSIPTGMCFANGGVVVVQAPHTLFLRDTNGDDKADERKILFSGWGTDDTHAGPSNIRWGFDNWIYGACGYSGFRGTVGGQRVSFGQGLWRMKPDGSKLEFLGSSDNNTWGLGLTEDGHVVASTANRNPSFYLHIPNRYYEQVQGFAPTRLRQIADSDRYFPIVEQIKVVDQHGSYTAGAGHALYTARSFPKDYWNAVSFVSEPTGHLIGRFRIRPDGSGFRARNDFSLLVSDDEWCSPIMAEVGPDGALWVIDWYNLIVQHNPIPPGFQKGKGNAYVTPLRDKRHGRIYKLVWQDGKPSRAFNLSNASGEKLVEALRSDNQLWRMHAQRLLVERRDKGALPALLALVNDKSVDEIGLNAPAVHALWTVQGVGAFEGEGDARAVAAATDALAHPSPGVRKAAADVLPRTARSAGAILAGKLHQDRDPHVRKAALLALAEMPPADASGAASFAVLSARENQNDPGLVDAATIAAARHDAGFLKAAFAAYGVQQPAASAAPAQPAQPMNLIPNGSFEKADGNRPAGWDQRHYSGSATRDWVEGGRTGQKCLRIQSTEGADSSWFTDVRVEPDTDYRVSAWIKTENVRGAMGGLLNVHGTEFRTNAVNGTSTDWRRVEINFNSGQRSVVSINCLFGGWGRSRGTAWYDDVELVKVPAALPGAVGRALTIVTGNYARRGPVDSVVATLSALKGADPKLAEAVVRGLADGWPENAAPKLSDRDIADLKSVMQSLPPEGQERLAALTARWGHRGLFAEQVAGLTESLRKQLAAAGTSNEQRIGTARRLVALDGGGDAISAILDQVTPAAPPEVQYGLIDALSQSPDASAGKVIVSRWSAFTPTGQRAAVAVLLRKPEWTAALLDAVQVASVSPRDLRAEHWQSMKNNPEASIASRAAQLEQAQGVRPNADKQKLIDSMAPLLTRRGDVSVGKTSFEKNCAVCHSFEGTGGKVGPDLTGIGARPKNELLAEMIDPNRSVEGTYRQWVVQTKDEVLNGRLLSESRTSIELIDSTGKTHTIERENIKRLKASELSVMPEGFEQLPQAEVAGILEYLSTSKVKH